MRYSKAKDKPEIPTYLWDKKKMFETDVQNECADKYPDNIKTINYKEYDNERFRKEIEDPDIPCKIVGCTEDWNIDKVWRSSDLRG